MTRPTTICRAETGVRPWYAEEAGFFGKNFLLEYSEWLRPGWTGLQADFVAEYASRAGGRILDIGCGNGRHMKPLTERGFIPFGLDLNAGMLASSEGTNVVRADMRRLPFGRVFATVVSLFSSFGFFSDDENRATIAEASRVLEPHGRLILDVINAEFIARRFGAHRTQVDAVRSRDGTERRHARSFDAATSRLYHERDFRDSTGRARRWHSDVRLYSAAELEEIAEEAGIETVALCGGYDGRPAGPEHPRLLFVGERPS